MRMRDRVVHGEKLRALRQEAGVPIKDFADAVDYSWRHIQMIETWGRQPSKKLLRRILTDLATRLGRDVTIDELSTPTTETQAAA